MATRNYRVLIKLNTFSPTYSIQHTSVRPVRSKETLEYWVGLRPSSYWIPSANFTADSSKTVPELDVRLPQ